MKSHHHPLGLKIAVLLLSACAGGTGLHGQATFTAADLKGTNIFGSMTVGLDNMFGMLSNGAAPLAGQFDYAIVDAEIGRLAASGLNSIRFFPSFFAYVTNPAGYMDTLRDFCNICNNHGIRITYVIWSAIGLSRPAPSADGVTSYELWHELIGTNPYATSNLQVYNGAATRAILLNNEFSLMQGVLPPGEPYFSGVHHDPGNELLAISGDYHAWPYSLDLRIDAYLTAIATFFTQDPAGIQAFFSYDLFNEPNGGANVYGAPLGNYLQFIKTTYDLLYGIHPNAEYTVGWAGAGSEADALENSLLQIGVTTTYYSVHSYAGGDTFERDMIARKAIADQRGVPLVCSEFYRTDFSAGTLKYQLAALANHGIGGQMWGFLQGNVFNNYDPYGFQALDGIYVPIPTPGPGAPVTFYPNNLQDVQAVSDWTSGSLSVGAYTRLRIQGLPEVLPYIDSLVPTGTNEVLQITSTRVGEPVLMLETAMAPSSLLCQATNIPTCNLIPGLGPILLEPQTQLHFLGTMPPSGSLNVPWSFPPAMSGSVMSLSVYVGNYPGQNFIQNTGELAEPLQFYLQ